MLLNFENLIRADKIRPDQTRYLVSQIRPFESKFTEISWLTLHKSYAKNAQQVILLTTQSITYFLQIDQKATFTKP